MEDIFRKYIDEFKLRIGKHSEDHDINTYHFHYWYEIFMLTEGSCKFPIKDKIYELQAGDVLFIPPNIPHFDLGAGTKTRINIEFTEKYMDNFARYSPGEYKGSKISRAVTEDFPKKY